MPGYRTTTGGVLGGVGYEDGNGLVFGIGGGRAGKGCSQSGRQWSLVSITCCWKTRCPRRGDARAVLCKACRRRCLRPSRKCTRAWTNTNARPAAKDLGRCWAAFAALYTFHGVDRWDGGSASTSSTWRRVAPRRRANCISVPVLSGIRLSSPTRGVEACRGDRCSTSMPSDRSNAAEASPSGRMMGTAMVFLGCASRAWTAAGRLPRLERHYAAWASLAIGSVVAAANAWSRSATISSMCSMPTERRT